MKISAPVNKVYNKNDYEIVDDLYDFLSNQKVDITNIDNIFSCWDEICLIDYKSFRQIIAGYVYAVGFDNLEIGYQRIVASHFCVAKDSRDKVFTLQEQIEHGRTFHTLSVECRSKRMEKVMCELYNRLGKLETQEIIKDVTKDDLHYNYINYGLEGTASGDSEGIFDYLVSTVGTVYELNGLSTKSFIPLDITMSELSTRCFNILS